MHVICFYWQGDRWQQDNFKQSSSHVNKQQSHIGRVGKVSDDLPARYINNLYWGVKRNTVLKFDFICFTNENLQLDPAISVRRFKMPTMQGVLPRLYMFSKAAGLFGEQVLCLDIDILITGSMNRLMAYDGLFCARSNFGKDRKPDGDIMSFTAGKKTEDIFWNPFIKDIEKAEQITDGRERKWIWHVMQKHPEVANLFDDYAPNQIASYKMNIRRINCVPKNVSIVSCHGSPRPHQLKEPWLKKYWL